MRNFINLQFENASDNDILEIIGEKRLSKIISKDPHPKFMKFSIAHEGYTDGNAIGFGRMVIRWISDSIKRIYTKIQMGSLFFELHEKNTNSHAGREKIGEVVGKKIDEIDGKTNTFVVGYIYPEFRDRDYDVASLEGEFEIENNGNIGIANPVNVVEITGIALGNSKKTMRPAFKGATLQAALQMMAESEEKMITFEEVLNFIKEKKIRISDIYSRDAIENDDFTKGIIDDRLKKENDNTYHQSKRVELENKELKDKYKALEDKTNKLNSELLRKNSTEKMGKILNERNLSEPEKKYISKKWDSFSPTPEGNIDSEINSFLEEQVRELNNLKEIGLVHSGVEKEEKKSTKTEIDIDDDLDVYED